MMKSCFLFISVLSLAQAWSVEFHDNDRVVLLGNTVIERAQKYGHLETALTLSTGNAKVQFRNLGWSGDSVFGDARSYFGPPQEGFDRLKADLESFKPNLVILCYGAVAAFDGEAGVENFVQGYDRLLEMVTTAATPREIVLVSPPPAESLPAPMPDMTKHNADLARYRDAIRALAERRKIQFVDLFETMIPHMGGLTDNGLHFTDHGYEILASDFMTAAGLTPPSSLHLESESGKKLREAIVAKNRLFFFQWRPSNETYLRLFRKHEQGQNAKELEEFKPIIQKRELEIDALKQATLQLKP